MKDLSMIDDEYKDGFELEVDSYRAKLASGADKDRAQEVFRKNIKKLIEKRNKESAKYIKSHKMELLGLHRQKEKKEKRVLPYKAYHIDFRKSFFSRVKIYLKFLFFRASLIFRGVYYNVVPSFVKFLFFRIGLFLSSVFFDVKMFFAYVNRGIGRFIRRRVAFLVLVYKKSVDILKKGYSFIVDILKSVVKFLREKKDLVLNFLKKKKKDEGEGEDEKKESGEEDLEEKKEDEGEEKKKKEGEN